MADATSPSAFILQMVRAHYGADERAFNYAASALARHAKSEQVRREILSIVARGARTTSQRYLPERGSTQQLQPVPTSSSLYALADVSFPELLLEDPLQQLLDEIVVELEYAPALAERGLRARNRLLFHGPPGNGKTASAAALANALGNRAYCVSIPQLVGSHMGETSKHVAEVFGQLRDGMVVVFDEIDAVGASRSQDDQACAKEQNGVVNSMLQLLDRHKSGVVVGTTNRPDMLDPALRRRFDEQVLFPPPVDDPAAIPRAEARREVRDRSRARRRLPELRRGDHARDHRGAPTSDGRADLGRSGQRKRRRDRWQPRDAALKTSRPSKRIESRSSDSRRICPSS